jgi:heme-degrading monooxygenase HmoA
VLGGALAEPVDGAVLLFEGDSPEVAAKFARNDPYVISGAVKRWHVREWTTVVAHDAAKPVVPKEPDAGAKSTGKAAELSSAAKSSQPDGKIARLWRGRSTVQNAPEYAAHAIRKVFPRLRAIDGYRGAWLLRRAIGDAVEFAVLTIWESMDAVRKFAGPTPEKAVVDPEARAVLTSFDESVEHFEIVDSDEAGRPGSAM